MALLDTAAKNRVKRSIMRYWSNNQVETSFGKPALSDAIDHVDQWLDNNFTASQNEGLNVSFPTTFKTGATRAMKDELTAFVLARRVSLEFFNQLWGDDA